jgi:hypothetical protein
MSLANDICRCHDDGCRDALRCARFTERMYGNPQTPRCVSLFPYDVPLGDPCPMLIPSDATGNLARPTGPVDSQASR